MFALLCRPVTKTIFLNTVLVVISVYLIFLFVLSSTPINSNLIGPLIRHLFSVSCLLIDLGIFGSFLSLPHLLDN